MAFAISSFNTKVTNYDQALEYWSSAKPWRGEVGENDDRPLKHRRNRNMGVRKLANGNIAFRFHHTDVVTYTPANTVWLVPYASVSTDAFASALTPERIYAGFNSGYINIEGKLFKVLHGDPIEIDVATKEIIKGHEPWSRDVLNVKRANAACKALGYRQFAQMVTAMDRLSPHRVFHTSGYRTDKSDLLRMLSDRTQWADLANLLPTDQLLPRLRKAVAWGHDCYDTQTVDYLTSWSQLRTFKK